MRTLKLTLAYDGTRYSGWQVQSNTSKPTIQGTLQTTLAQILQERVSVMGSGRTDAGVHALAQVAHVRTGSSIDPQRLMWALNSVLPRDLAVLKVEEAAPGFHAQFDAVSKRYRYTIVIGPVVLPFERRYVQQVHVPLNVALMRREAKVLLGRHDAAAFQSTGRLVRDTRRTITDLRITKKGNRIEIEVEANGFLYMMVRRIAGTLIELGRGRLPAGTIQRMISSKNPQHGGPPAPARGLCLVSVTYPAARPRAW